MKYRLCKFYINIFTYIYILNYAYKLNKKILMQLNNVFFYKKKKLKEYIFHP